MFPEEYGLTSVLQVDYSSLEDEVSTRVISSTSLSDGWSSTRTSYWADFLPRKALPATRATPPTTAAAILGGDLMGGTTFRWKKLGSLTAVSPSPTVMTGEGAVLVLSDM